MLLLLFVFILILCVHIFFSPQVFCTFANIEIVFALIYYRSSGGL